MNSLIFSYFGLYPKHGCLNYTSSDMITRKPKRRRAAAILAARVYPPTALLKGERGGE